MNRNLWLFFLVAFLLVANIVWRIYSHWGLITVHANPQPISQVIRSIERQGGVTIRTDFAPDTPVTMNVTRVPLGEALESLATVTDGRYRLTYVLAPQKSDIAMVLANFAAGQPLDKWKTAYVRLLPVGDAPLTPPDPRQDRWAVQPAQENTLQAYLEQGARNVSAAFLYPEEWNPPVSSAPSAGPVRKVVPKLAKLAKGQEQEVFFLTKPRQRETAGAEDEAPREFMGGGDALLQRMQAEAAKLPPAQRGAAEERIEFAKSLAGLSREERRAKLEEFLQQPGIQEQLEQRSLDHDSRMTPQQRLQRAERYAQRRQQVRNASTNQ